MTDAKTPLSVPPVYTGRPFRVFDEDQRRYTRWRMFARGVLLRGLAFHLVAKVGTYGMAEHLPASGATILMMNHVSGIDPFVVMGAVGPRFVEAMSKIENYQVPLLGTLMRLWGCYPVLRGEIDRRALEFTIKLLNEGNLVLIAPQGTREPAISTVKDGMAYLAVKTGATIVPVGLKGTADVMRSVKHLRRTPITLTFGRAFRFRSQGRVVRAELPIMTREAMYQLAPLVDEQQRGVYADLSQATTNMLEFVN